MSPADFMFRRRFRLGLVEPLEGPLKPTGGRPAVLLAPIPTTGVRYAVKGERPPSRFSPGQSDGVIERFDVYAAAHAAGRVKHGR